MVHGHDIRAEQPAALRNHLETLVCSLAVLLTLGVGAARAQQAANPELGEVGAGGNASASGSAKGTWQPPTNAQIAAQNEANANGGAAASNDNTGPTPEAGATEGANGTDHAGVVHHWGVGFFGVVGVPSGGCALPGGAGPASGTCPFGAAVVDAPTVGVRYWMEEGLAIEAALGIGIQSGGVKHTVTGPAGASGEINEPSLTAIAIHGGLPLVFAESKHFAFEVVPELNFGFATGSWTSPANTSVDLSGLLFELGGRVGAEIQFGFIDIPQLSLEGSVGLHLRVENASATQNNVPAGGSTEDSQSRFRFGTTVQGEPWDIFTGNIRAIYYF
jgi:hypothetical protein